MDYLPTLGGAVWRGVGNKFLDCRDGTDTPCAHELFRLCDRQPKPNLFSYLSEQITHTHTTVAYYS